jgi:adenylate cyclase
VAIDFEKEGLLTGLRGKAREARLRLLEELAADGVSLDELKRAVTDDRLALLPVERLLEGDGRRYTAGEVAEEVGLDADVLARQRQALGLPQPDPQESAFTDEDVEAARRVKAFLDAGLSEEGMLEVARVMGMAMSQVAAANRSLIAGSLMKPGDTERDLGLRYANAARELIPLQVPMLEYAMRLHQREQIRRDVVGRAQIASGELPGTVEISACFADLVGFTKLGEELAVDELGAVAGRLNELAGSVANPPVRLVKMMGDAAMLVSPDNGALVDAALTLVDAAEGEHAGFPQLRAGMARGPALNRGGDWFGRPVNLASRLTAVALPGSVLAAEEVREADEEGAYHWSFAGERRLKGIEGQVKGYRARREPKDAEEKR